MPFYRIYEISDEENAGVITMYFDDIINVICYVSSLNRQEILDAGISYDFEGISV
jgi:hypothetical protein